MTTLLKQTQAAFKARRLEARLPNSAEKARRLARLTAKLREILRELLSTAKSLAVVVGAWDIKITYDYTLKLCAEDIINDILAGRTRLVSVTF